MTQEQPNQLVFETVGVDSGRYQDKVRTIRARNIDNMTVQEVKAEIERRFAVGEAWYSNKLEGFYKLGDGSGYQFKIREPYTD